MCVLCQYCDMYLLYCIKKIINILHIYLYDTNVYILGWVWFGFNNIYILSIVCFLNAFLKTNFFEPRP
jgi:hypothetical protein